MELPDTIPAHQLLTPDIARMIYERLAEVVNTATHDNNHVHIAMEQASKQIQQTVVDFVQAEIERAERNGLPFRLVARFA